MQRKSIFIPHCLFIISTLHCVLQFILHVSKVLHYRL